MKSIKSIWFILILWGTTHGIYEEFGSKFNFDRLYPITNFKRIEIVCRDLWFDLDQISESKELQKKVVEDAHYLADRFLLFEKCLERMVNDSQESISYLREDIEYLVEMLTLFDTKYQQLCEQLSYDHDESKIRIINSLQRSKEYIVQLFANNKEVIL